MIHLNQKANSYAWKSASHNYFLIMPIFSSIRLIRQPKTLVLAILKVHHILMYRQIDEWLCKEYHLKFLTNFHFLMVDNKNSEWNYTQRERGIGHGESILTVDHGDEGPP